MLPNSPGVSSGRCQRFRGKRGTSSLRAPHLPLLMQRLLLGSMPWHPHLRTSPRMQPLWPQHVPTKKPSWRSCWRRLPIHCLISPQPQPLMLKAQANGEGPPCGLDGDGGKLGGPWRPKASSSKRCKLYEMRKKPKKGAASCSDDEEAEKQGTGSDGSHGRMVRFGVWDPQEKPRAPSQKTGTSRLHATATVFRVLTDNVGRAKNHFA